MLKDALQAINKIPTPIRQLIKSGGMYSTGWGFVIPFFDIYLKTLSGSNWIFGLVKSINYLAGIIASLVIGWFEENHSHKNIIIGGKILAIIEAGLFLYAGLTVQLWPAIIASILRSFAAPMVWLSTRSYIRMYGHGTASAATFGYFTFKINFSFFFFGVLGGSLISMYYQIYWTFPFIALFALISIFMDQRIPDCPHPKPKKNKIHHHLKKHWYSFLELPSRVYLYMFINESHKIALLTNVMFLGIFAIEQKGLSIVEIGLMYAFGLLPFIGAVAFAQIGDHIKHKFRFTALVGLATTIPLAVIAMSNNFYVIMLAAFSITALEMTRIAMTESLLTAMTPAKSESTMSGIQSSIERIAAVIGFVGLGYLADTLGYAQLYLISIGLIIGSTLLLIMFFVRGEKTGKHKMQHLHYHPRFVASSPCRECSPMDKSKS